MSNQQATMICMDCSEYVRNGDYSPNRFEAQRDAVDRIMRTKLSSNPENVVGVMSSGGKRPEILATLTNDDGKLLTVIHKSHRNIFGASDLPAAVELAQLALKHREKKPQRPRIVLFVGSPIPSDVERKLTRKGALLRKENVSVDVISYGGYAENDEILKKFVEAANSGDNSSFLSVRPGQSIVEALRGSESLGGGNDVGGMGGFGGEEDPDILLAIQRSLEEQRAREGASGATDAPTNDVDGGDDDEEARALQEAMALSKQAAGVESTTKSYDEMTEDEQMALALQMSLGDTGMDPSSTTTTTKEEEKEETKEKDDGDVEMADEEDKSSTSTTATGASEAGEEGAVSVDREFVNSLLQSLPGVDVNDPAIQSVLASLSDAGSFDPSVLSGLVGASTSGGGGGGGGDAEDEEMDEDEALAAALAMSMADQEEDGDASS